MVGEDGELRQQGRETNRIDLQKIRAHRVELHCRGGGDINVSSTLEAQEAGVSCSSLPSSSPPALASSESVGGTLWSKKILAEYARIRCDATNPAAAAMVGQR